jgi:hypothetical protein
MNKKKNESEVIFSLTVLLNIILNILGFEYNIVKIILVLLLIGIYLYFAKKNNKFKEKRYYIYIFVIILIFTENIYALFFIK